MRQVAHCFQKQYTSLARGLHWRPFSIAPGYSLRLEIMEYIVTWSQIFPRVYWNSEAPWEDYNHAQSRLSFAHADKNDTNIIPVNRKKHHPSKCIIYQARWRQIRIDCWCNNKAFPILVLRDVEAEVFLIVPPQLKIVRSRVGEDLFGGECENSIWLWKGENILTSTARVQRCV